MNAADVHENNHFMEIYDDLFLHHRGPSVAETRDLLAYDDHV